MLRAGACVLVLTALSGVGLAGQAAESRTWLLFYDELHVDFQSTPRIRAAAQRIVTAVTRGGDRWAIVTTGTSGVVVPPTSDQAVITQALRRVIGNGRMMAQAFIDARQHIDGVLELRQRAAIAVSVATSAIKGVSAAQNGRPFAVLYLTNGYDDGLIADEITGLIQTAIDANAAVYTIDPRGLTTADASVSPRDWDSYLDVTRRALGTLATRTGGMAVFTEAGLDSALSRLAEGGR